MVEVEVISSAELIKLRTERKRLRLALADLVGATDRQELECMAAMIPLAGVPERDKVAMLNAIQVLIETE